MTNPAAIPRPLVVTSDPATLDELLRLCAAAGVTPEVASDAGHARPSWSSATCVVVGAGDVESLIGAVDRRDGVIILAEDAGDASVWSQAVGLGAEAVYVLPEHEAMVVDLLAASDDGSDRDATIVGVVGGCGGAGSSTFAASLAVTTSRRGSASLLVDADPFGGGIDLIVGNEHADGVRWPDLAATHGRVSGESLRQVLPDASGLSVLSWDRGDLDEVPRESMRSVLSAGRRSHDAIVVDVPRCPDPAAEEALVRATCTVLLVPAEVHAVSAARRVLARIRPLCADVRLVVRTPGPTGLVADDVADTLAVPLITSMRSDRRLPEFVDGGFGPLTRRRTPLVRACGAVIADLGLVGPVAA